MTARTIRTATQIAILSVLATVLVLGTTAAISPAAIAPAGAPAGAAPQGQDRHGEEHSPLHDAMFGLKRHLKALNGALRDPAKDAESLEHLAGMQAIVLETKLMPPSNLASVPEANRAAHQASYRKDMARLLRELSEIEIDLLDGKREAAIVRVQGPLVELRDASHERYQE